MAYPGTGGSASSAAVKINFIIDIKSLDVVSLSTHAGSMGDPGLSSSILNLVQEKDLVIRDLAFNNSSNFSDFSSKKVYFLSRYKAKTTLYLSKNESSAINLIEYLGNHFKRFNTMDLRCFYSQSKCLLRVIAFKASVEVATERRRKLRRAAQKNGRTPSAEALALCDYYIFITNAAEDTLPADSVADLYSIRWQIELIFKTWKSGLKLQKNLIGANKNRIDCLIYATLIMAFLTLLIMNWLRRVGIDSLGHEISIQKLIKWLLGNKNFICLSKGSAKNLQEQLLKALRRIKKQKRKRLTTLEKIHALSDD